MQTKQNKANQNNMHNDTNFNTIQCKTNYKLQTTTREQQERPDAHHHSPLPTYSLSLSLRIISSFRFSQRAMALTRSIPLGAGKPFLNASNPTQRALRCVA
mmetsp:Transcript_4415/g.9573  ORF Transcript_4415/g.9573 Transcript_4415/m.9573 type:complete len:101 (-) Transcript_4415:117-419(-)